jgi:preprotein translocase SecE subunit
MTAPAANTKPAPQRPGGSDGASAQRGGLGQYLRDVRTELKKAQWPTKPELIKLTRVVLGVITIVALFCGALDAGLGWLTGRLFGFGQ